MTFSDGLTVSAIVLAVVAIASEVLFFIVQTDRATKSQREISDYVGQMRGVLAKIEGLTTGTREELREQLTRLLDFALSEQRASVSDKLEDKVVGIEQRVVAVEERSEGSGDEELRMAVAELKRDVGSLQGELAGLRAGAPSAEKGVVTDSDAVMRITRDFLSSGKMSFPTVGDLARQAFADLARQAEMTRLLQDLATSPGDAPWLMFKYGEAFKAAERAGLIETYHDAGQAGFGVRLTDAGHAFLAAGSRTKDGAAE